MKTIRVFAWFILPCIALMAGCASPAKPAAMIAHNFPKATTTHEPVVVQVTGGAKTDPMWTSKIASDDFRKTSLFRSAETNGACAYRLEVRLEVLEQPMFGFDLTVNLRADWKLSDSKDNRELWHERVVSTHTATVGDAFAAIERLRIANEGAARKNIEQGLEKLAAVTF